MKYLSNKVYLNPLERKKMERDGLVCWLGGGVAVGEVKIKILYIILLHNPPYQLMS